MAEQTAPTGSGTVAPNSLEELKAKHLEEINQFKTKVISLERQLQIKNHHLERTENELRELRVSVRDKQQADEEKSKITSTRSKQATIHDMSKQMLIRELDEMKLVDMKRKKEIENLKAELERAEKMVDVCKSTIGRLHV
eukprot:Colp12_sorted_trinity150504_noHs@6507